MANRTGHILALTSLLVSTPLFAQQAQTLPAGSVRPTPLPAPAPEQPQTLPAPVPPNNRPPHNRPPQQQPPVTQPTQWFAGQVRCESSRNRQETCRANTRNRVELVQVHGGSCNTRDYSYTANAIMVRNNCRATFAYGYGNHRPKVDSGGGSSALPWLLAGAGATAGIIAIANSGNNSQPEPDRAAPPPPPPSQPAPTPQPAPEPAPPSTPQPPFAALPPAKLQANIQMLTPAQQPSMQTCLFEGSRQVGLSGGTVARLDAVDQIEQGNGGWRFRFRATGTWPNGQRQFSVFCRSTPTQVIEFTTTPLGAVQ